MDWLGKIHFINNYDPQKGGTINESTGPQQIRMWNGYVVLRHDSDVHINDGVIDRSNGRQNGYSKNSDRGSFFWASEKPGNDPSNNQKYEYYCFVSPSDVYDFRDNPNGYKSFNEAVDNEKYVVTEWGDGALVANTLLSTMISFIRAKGDSLEPGGVFDSEWHLLRTTTVYQTKRLNMELAQRMRDWQDVEVPDFLGGYDYNDVISAKTYN
jgi:hypothetical protein